MEDLGGSGRRWEKLGGFETSWKDPAGGRRIWKELGGGRSSWEELGVVNRKTIDNMNALVTIQLLLKTQTMAILIRRIILLGTCLQLLSVSP